MAEVIVATDLADGVVASMNSNLGRVMLVRAGREKIRRGYARSVDLYFYPTCARSLLARLLTGRVRGRQSGPTATAPSSAVFGTERTLFARQEPAPRAVSWRPRRLRGRTGCCTVAAARLRTRCARASYSVMACLCPILASQRGDAFAERLAPFALLHSRLSTAAFLSGFVLGVSTGPWAAFESSSRLGVRMAP